MKLQLAVIYKVVKNKIKIDYGPFPLHHRKRHRVRLQRAAQWARSSSSPCSEQRCLLCPSSMGPPGRSATAHCGTMNYCQHSMFLHWESLGLSCWEDQNPRDQVPLLQTEVTVLTLAERACLNLLFRSCMLGDLGLGMREVLRFSGVLLGGCL